MKTKSDPRHQSRIIVLQKLFEQEFSANLPYDISQLQHINDDTVIDNEFIQYLLNGVNTNKEEIDAKIRQYTLKRPFGDTSKIDLLILRISLFELLFSEKKAPVKVIIDEAIELAKEFGGDKSFTFVNGVLGNISQDTHYA